MSAISPTNHLAKGRACIDCRRRKVRCGGELPSCKRCVKGGYGLDCQYVNHRGKTGVQLLEASVTRLETRLAALQNTVNQKEAILQICVPGRGGMRQTGGESFRLVPPGFITAVHVASVPYGWWAQSKMPLEVAVLLMDYFAPYAFQFGFFLHGPRLCQLMFEHSNPSSPAPNLLNVIYLWGIHLSDDERLLAHEPFFLERAVRVDLTSQQPQYVVHNIQAEILLVAYFLRSGNPSSAIHHLNHAISLCISYGLHRQAFNDSNRPVDALDLPPPHDFIDRGERIDAFWTTFLFYKTLAVQQRALSEISVIMDETIDTPFPLEMKTYEDGSAPSNPYGVPTMKNFIDAPAADLSHGILALTAKAAALFERARIYGNEWRPILHPDGQKFETDLLNFIKSIPPLTQFVGPYTKYTWITVVTLLHVAIIHFHSSGKYEDSNRKRLNAAQQAANLIAKFKESNTVQHIHPIMAPLWYTVCKTLMTGIQEQEYHGTPEDVDPMIKHLLQSLKTVVQVMEELSCNCYEMKTHLKRLYQGFHDILSLRYQSLSV
ncbi:hypothetical protein C8R42DRAFT_456841 [Lentinula raphanica]|nr:hypothetical protein C8R42DRAFT_456841 [Lentinula raphanica]